MLSNLILYRSLTRAQKAAAALERAGIPNRLIRTPKAVAGEGCSHSVRLSQRHLPQAIEQLTILGLEPRRIFVTAGDGNFEEVHL